MEIDKRKQREIAYGLTLLATVAEPYHHPELYEIGQNTGLVLIAGKRYGVDRYVFIPEDEWREALELKAREKMYYGQNPEWKCKRLIHSYINGAAEYDNGLR
jgi:hypothetical protein